MSLALKYTLNEECNYKEVRIDEESFRLQTGGYVYDP